MAELDFINIPSSLIRPFINHVNARNSVLSYQHRLFGTVNIPSKKVMLKIARLPTAQLGEKGSYLHCGEVATEIHSFLIIF